MTPKLIVLSLALALVATVTFAAPAGEDAGAATEREMVLDPTTGEMISAPEYGGTFTFPLKEEPASTDSFGAVTIVSHVLELVSIADWAIPRDEFDFNVLVAPANTTGALAESWSQPDPLTIILNIRQGVRWHDKAPMNGRALTAADIEFNYHRMMGLGSGFTERLYGSDLLAGVEVESVTATDSSTVEFKLARPSVSVLAKIIQGPINLIYPPEVIRAEGDGEDWRDLVGTGPYSLTDWTKGSSITYDKNPDYWGFDEKFPENRLPYFDQLRTLIMPEASTYVSALRTGQLDYVGALSLTQLRTIDELESLQRTNPELVPSPYGLRSDNAVAPNTQVEPFGDIRVRKALQMAINLEEINQGFYKGFADTIPQGQISRFNAAVAVQFDEWPADVRKVFEYDPAGAEALLDEAGYPRGADGVRFKTEILHQKRFDLNHTELLISYWDAIGVKVEAEVRGGAEYGARRNAREYELITAEGACKCPAIQILGKFLPTAGWNTSNVDDQWYQAKFDEAAGATTLDEQNAALRELDMYSIEQFWQLFGPIGPQFNLVQPWVAGFNGESTMGWARAVFWRIWFDSSLKP